MTIKKKPDAAALLKRNLSKPKRIKPEPITDAADQAVARRLGDRQIVHVTGLPPKPMSESEAWDRVLELGRRLKAEPAEQGQPAPAAPESPSYIINRMIVNSGQASSSPIPLNGPRVTAAALSGMDVSVQDGRRE